MSLDLLLAYGVYAAIRLDVEQWLDEYGKELPRV